MVVAVLDAKQQQSWWGELILSGIGPCFHTIMMQACHGAAAGSSS